MSRKTGVAAVMLALAAGCMLWLYQQPGGVTSRSAVVESERIPIAATVSGVVAETYIAPGDVVKQGQALFALESSGFAAHLASEQALLAKLAASLPGGIAVPSPMAGPPAAPGKDLGTLRLEEEEARKAVAVAAHVYGAASIALTRLGEGAAGAYSVVDPKRQAARITRDEAALALQQAKDAYEKASYARARREMEEKNTARSGMSAALAARIAEYQAQLSRVRLAEQNLAAAVVRAPQGGRVETFAAAGGKSVAAGESLGSILPDHGGALWISARFASADARSLAPGQACLVFAGGGAGLPGRVAAITPPAKAEKEVAVRVILDQNAEPFPVRQGQTVRVTVPAGDAKN